MERRHPCRRFAGIPAGFVIHIPPITDINLPTRP